MENKELSMQNIFYFVATIGVVGILIKLYGSPILPWQVGFPGWAPASAALPVAPVPGASTTDNVSTTTIVAGTVVPPTTGAPTSSAGSPQFVVDSQLNFSFNGLTGNLASVQLPSSIGGMSGQPGYSIVSCVGGTYLVNILDGSGNTLRSVNISAAGSY